MMGDDEFVFLFALFIQFFMLGNLYFLIVNVPLLLFLFKYTTIFLHYFDYDTIAMIYLACFALSPKLIYDTE